MSQTNPFEDEAANAAAAPFDPNEAISPEDAAAAAGSPPPWVNEGTQDDDDVIPGGQDISKAKPMEPRAEWIDPAKGVLFSIAKAVIDTRFPKDKDVWRSKEMNIWLQIKDGIVYKKGEPPKYKNKMFFHRVTVAVNRAVDPATNKPYYDFSKNAKGEATTWWEPSGGAFGEYNQFLQAMGFNTAAIPTNDKAFRQALVGRTVFYDVEKVPAEKYNPSTKKSERIPNEFTNKLTGPKPAGAATNKTTAAPAAAAAADADSNPWTE